MSNLRDGDAKPGEGGDVGAAPDVSVVVITRNRASLLADCLDAIVVAALAAPHLAVELVVVDNGSTDDTLARLAAWAEGARGLRVRILVELQPGAGFARNAGVAAARGRLLVLTDDDCRLAEDYIAAAHRLAAADQGLTLRGGRVELGDDRDLPFTVKVDPERQVYTDGTPPGGFLLGCNVALTREAADRIGPFDTQFGPGTRLQSADDTDYLYRAHRAGLVVVYEPSLVVFHHHGRRDYSQIRRLFQGYNVGNGAIYAKFFREDPRIIRFLYWDLRHALGELMGGETFYPVLGLTYRSKIWGTLLGVWRYVQVVGRGPTGPRAARRGSGQPTAPPG